MGWTDLHRPFRCFAPQRPAYYWVQPVSRVDMGRSYMTQALRLHATLTPAYYKELPLRGSYSHSELNLVVGKCQLKHKFVFDADVMVKTVFVGADDGSVGIRDFLTHVVL